jgi:hypothetical protein
MQAPTAFLMAVLVCKMILAENDDTPAFAFTKPISAVVLGMMKTKHTQTPVCIARDVNYSAHFFYSVISFFF